jgi:hypothetical protein
MIRCLGLLFNHSALVDSDCSLRADSLMRQTDVFDKLKSLRFPPDKVTNLDVNNNWLLRETPHLSAVIEELLIN